MIPQRRKGTDIIWSVIIADDNGVIDISTLTNIVVVLFYFQGNNRKKWLTYKLNMPDPGEKVIQVPTPASGEIFIPILNSDTITGPLGVIGCTVTIERLATSPMPAGTEKVSVLDENTGKDFHIICELIPAP